MSIRATIRTDGEACADYVGRDFTIGSGERTFDSGEVTRSGHDAKAACIAGFNATAPREGDFVVEVDGMLPVTSSRQSIAEAGGAPSAGRLT